VRKHCSVGCIACNICVKRSPEGGFTVENNLSSIDYSQKGDRTAAAEKCPPKCIIRVSPEPVAQPEPEPVAVATPEPVAERAAEAASEPAVEPVTRTAGTENGAGVDPETSGRAEDAQGGDETS
jgi:hypothetical protein